MVAELNTALVKSYEREDRFYPGVLLGLLCTINGFMFTVGGLNLRISDIPFYILIIYWIFFKSRIRLFYSREILRGLGIVFCIFTWIAVSGFLNLSMYSDIYQEYFVKYLINKVLWIPIYAVIYMIYGGKDFFVGVFWGISICALINSGMVLYEYYTIQNGYLPEYEFFKSLGVVMDEKKSMVINQNMIRPTGLMLDPNYTGAYCGIGIIFFDSLYRSSKKKRYLFFSILCVVPMLILFSRTGIFSFIMCYIISVFFYLKNNKRYNLISQKVILIAICAGICIFTYILSLDYGMFERLTDRFLMKDSSASTRTDYIWYYFSLVNPIQLLFGVGNAGNFLTDFYGYQNIVWAPESSVITLFIEEGLIFNILFYWVVVKTFFKLIKTNYYYAFIFAYINFIGLSYNFLGDRVYLCLSVLFILYTYAIEPTRSILKYN